MSTATIAFVRGVTAASTAAGSRLYVRGSMSAKTGVAPSYIAQFAEATNEYGDVITSSPGPTPARCMQRCSPAVPDETAAQYGAPTASASSCLEPRAGRAEREPARAQHLEHELLVALVDPRRARARSARRCVGASSALRSRACVRRRARATAYQRSLAPRTVSR